MDSKTPPRLQSLNFSAIARSLLISGLAGGSAGVSVALFISAMDWAVHLHQAHPTLILALPILGAALGFIALYFGVRGKTEMSQISEKTRDPGDEEIKAPLPMSFAPWVFFSSVLTQIGGASAGREGGALQIAAATADQWTRIFRMSPSSRSLLLKAGVAGGFSAALGTPFAGSLFALEIHGGIHSTQCGLLRTWVNFGGVLISSWIAVSLRDLFHVPKIDFPSFSGHALEFTSILSSFFASVLIGITAALLVRLFFFARGNLGVLLLKSSTSPIIRGAIGGSVLSILYFMGPFDAYRGLGIDGLEASFREVPALGAPILKLLFTALALAAGFKGGEFIPLFFVGASAGSVIHGLGVTPFTGSSGMNVGDFAAIGCVSVFSGASRMPITCLVLGIELFGAEISPMLLISLMLVHWLSGKKSIYST